MKHAVFALLLISTPVMAEAPAPKEDLDQGLSLMQEGAQMLLRHMMSQVEPSLQDMTDALKQAQPKLMEILAMIDDIQNYHAPEKLPNGDIIMRRKTPAEIKLDSLSGPATDL